MSLAPSLRLSKHQPPSLYAQNSSDLPHSSGRRTSSGFGGLWGSQEDEPLERIPSFPFKIKLINITECSSSIALFSLHLFSFHNPLTPFIDLAFDRGNKLGLILVPFFLILLKRKMKSLFVRRGGSLSISHSCLPTLSKTSGTQLQRHATRRI